VLIDRQEVFRYDGSPQAWTRIGGDFGQLYGGGFGLVATSSRQIDVFEPGHLWLWRRRLHRGGLHAWHPIGLPGAMFAVTAEAVYGLTPDRGAVFRHDGGVGTSWTQVGGAAGQLYGGTFGLVATNPENGNLFRYLGTPDSWEQIGGPGAEFAVTRDTVFGLTPNRDAVFRYDGIGASWTSVGGPAAAICAFNEEDTD
jgi:hypothetical protein